MNKSLTTLNVLLNFKKYIQSIFPTTLGYLVNGELLIVVPTSKITKVLRFLRDHTHGQFKSLSDLSGVDYPYKKNRFEVVYNLLNITYNTRISVITYVDEITSIDSIVSLYKCANWFEREVWDMYGVFFYKNKDLRRILTDYGFKGHPLRKDFPVTGYIEVRYDELQKRVITEKVSFAQDYRDFTFHSNWLQ
jgi:NADH dehydrogenase (ubiquinone) Fe-S protein 3